MSFQKWISSVRGVLGRPSSVAISLGVLVIIHLYAVRHPPELFRDRTGPLFHEFWSPRPWRGYPERPVIYRVAQVLTHAGPVMISDDVYADYEAAIRRAHMERTQFAEYAAYRRTDTYGLWFGSIRLQGWDVYRVQRDLWFESNGLTALASRDPRIRFFAAHPQLPGRLPVLVEPLLGLAGDLLGFIAAASFIVGAISLLFRMFSAVRAGWRVIPDGHCPDCGYDLTGLPAPVCPECGGRMNSASPG